MQAKNYFCLNGEVISTATPNVLSFQNRAFRFGDAVFESMRATGTTIHYYDDHYKRLEKGMQTLKIDPKGIFNKQILEQQISRLLTRNRFFTGTRLRVSVFRESESIGYMPKSKKAGYIIECEQLEDAHYRLNEKGLVTDIFPDIRKPLNLFSGIKSANALLFVMAALWKQEQGFDDAILLNEQGNICETTSSNIFMTLGNKLYTPPLSDGCLSGVMRKQVIRIAQASGCQVITETSIAPEHLPAFDEVFITNAARGIAWVVGYKKKRYFNKLSKQLIGALNRDVDSIHSGI